MQLLSSMLESCLFLSTGAETLRICSLGSGPGTDLVSILFFLKERYGTMKIHATFVDLCDGWRCVIEDIISQLKNPEYVGDMVSKENFEIQHIVADLLTFNGSTSPPAINIQSADVISMMKFVSAATCTGTEEMLKVCNKLQSL